MIHTDGHPTICHYGSRRPRDAREQLMERLTEEDFATLVEEVDLPTLIRETDEYYEDRT